jgi:hypothetical protein
MKTHEISQHAWRTAAYGDTAKTSRIELLMLGEHLNACQNWHRHLLTLHRVAKSMHGFAATRFVTTLVIFATLFSLGFWML